MSVNPLAVSLAVGAAVSAAGVVTAAAAGSATVTATSEGVSGSASAQVTARVNEVILKPGQSIQAAVDANPAGTRFRLRAGIYRRQTVVPKSGTVLYGDPGAVLDGEGVTTYAVRTPRSAPYPSNVRIHGLIIRNYMPPDQLGAVKAGGHKVSEGSHGWMVDSNEIRNNRSVGIKVGNATRVIGNLITQNGQLGIGGAGDSALIERNTITQNNYAHAYRMGWEAGGIKLAVSRGHVIRGNAVADNWGPGIWCDIDCVDVLIEDNRVEKNADSGIFYEISRRAVIRNNTVVGNGYQNAKWLYGAGILVSASSDVEVYGNTVTDNARGIAGIMQERGSGAYGRRSLENLYVHDNAITMRAADATAGQRSGVAQDIGDRSFFTTRGNRFERNRYVLGTARRYFEWMNAQLTEAQWRAYGQDTAGTFTR